MKKLNYFLIAILGLASASCETELDVSMVNQQKKIVITALLNDLDPVSIGVSKSTVIQDSLIPAPLTNAVVTFTDESGNVNTCTYDGLTEKYVNTLIPQSGKTYTIKVKAPGFPDASAVVSIPAKASLNKSTWRDSTGLDSFGFPTGTISVNLDDRADVKNYYRITIYYWDDLTAEWRVLGPASTDAEINNRAIKTEDGGIIFDDRSFNGDNRVVEFITPFADPNITPKYLVVSESLSAEYYRYFKSLDDYKNSGGLFSEPTAVFTNITNGLGIAAGSSARKDVIL